MSEKSPIHKVIIIGGGCAGLSAAIYSARAELKPLAFVGNLENKGGLLVKTSIVENYPGFPDGILGFDLVSNMEKQAENAGATIINRSIDKFDFSKRPFKLIDSEGTEYFSETVIIATGSTPNKLALDNEENLWSKGISSCAVCDGVLYKRKKIMVVGGGDSAIEEALFLTKFSDVVLVHRREEFRASKVMVKRLMENPKIRLILNSTLVKLEGTEKLESVKLMNVKENVMSESIKVDGLFYGLGLKPNTSLFNRVVKMDSDGYILHAGKHFETMTSIDGVFVAGDAHDKIYRQAIVASGDGCKAALDANNFINEHLE